MNIKVYDTIIIGTENQRQCDCYWTKLAKIRKVYLLSIMVKIRDDLEGRIGKTWVNKKLVPADKMKLKIGIGIAKDILQQANAKSIFSSHHFAAHLGGSVKIGEAVDTNLQSEMTGLYVCDASVIPEPWGLAPSYSLICLGMRLAKHLN